MVVLIMLQHKYLLFISQEMHAGFIESNLLNQVRVVWTGQIFPVWVQKSICIFVKTGKFVVFVAGNCLPIFTVIISQIMQYSFRYHRL